MEYKPRKHGHYPIFNFKNYLKQKPDKFYSKTSINYLASNLFDKRCYFQLNHVNYGNAPHQAKQRQKITYFLWILEHEGFKALLDIK
jgi:hypothetical protein